MCGICGFNSEDPALIKKMCDLIAHRGPDESNYFVDKDVSLGIRRLAIVDLIKGSQPQSNENEDAWIIFNGEIYNYLNLKKELEEKGHEFKTDSDTEAILHAYEEWGHECLKKFWGQFAFCIYDSINRKFFLVRDRLGIKPLYYYNVDGSFIFASEIKSILTHGIERKLNHDALNLYLSLKYVPFNSTLFENVFKLPAATYIVYDLEKKKYYIKKNTGISNSR